MRFDEYIIHLHQLHKRTIDLCHLRYPIRIHFEMFHKVLKRHIMRIGIHNPRSLISPDSVKLIEKILQLHEVHRRRRPSIKQPKLIKFEPIFLDVIIFKNVWVE